MEQIRHLIFGLSRSAQLFPYGFIPGITEYLPPFTAVVRYPGAAIGKTYNSTLAMVGAERAG